MCRAYHVHAFIAETTGFTMMGDLELRYRAAAGSLSAALAALRSWYRQVVRYLYR